MKKIHVAVAVIKDGDFILATQRGYGEFKGGWEFPGGKVEDGETPREALVREIEEELAAKIQVGDFIERLDYDYPDFHVTLDCFWANLCPGEKISLLEHLDAKWLNKETIDEVEWLPANIDFIQRLKECL